MSIDLEALRTAILAACDALDPQHQGEQWPDPIAWDGRQLTEMASDLLPLLEDHPAEAQAIREALG